MSSYGAFPRFQPPPVPVLTLRREGVTVQRPVARPVEPVRPAAVAAPVATQVSFPRPRIGRSTLGAA